MSTKDPRSFPNLWDFESILPGQGPYDPEVTYLEGDEAWIQWDLAVALSDAACKFRKEIYEARPL